MQQEAADEAAHREAEVAKARADEAAAVQQQARRAEQLREASEQVGVED
jgi:hypothetical protein